VICPLDTGTRPRRPDQEALPRLASAMTPGDSVGLIEQNNSG